MTPRPPPLSASTHVGRVLLAAFLAFAGVAHVSFARVAFRAQVPTWFPVDPDLVVLASGVVEVLLAAALLGPRRWRAAAGWVVAGYFVAIFPGNVAQWAQRRDAFGLDSDAARAVRLAFQPVLVAWALWCTGAWAAWRARRGRNRR